MSTLVCVGCQATATHTVVGGALGAIMRATGFTPVLSHDDRQGVLWTCPTCYDQAHALAKQVVQLLGGNEHIHFYGLLTPRSGL